MSTALRRAEDVEADDIRHQLDKILLSRQFAASPRLTRFLRFIVQASIDGKGAELNEHSLGLQVFDKRSASYMPGVDPIVRVQARRLRDRIHAYYEKDGAEDPILIEVPVGCYSPVFSLRRRAPNVATTADSKSAARQPNSLAVLPFASISADPDGENFSDGLTEELIFSLSRVSMLSVVARTSTLTFKHNPNDVRKIGTGLGVTRVLEGSVRKLGGRLRVTARLVNVADGYHVWSAQFDRNFTDLFKVQEQISRAISKAICCQIERSL